MSASRFTQSADGRYLTYKEVADNQVYIYDLVHQVKNVISTSSDGTTGNDVSTDPSISADGKVVVFTSESTNLVEGDTNGTTDIFVRGASRPPLILVHGWQRFDSEGYTCDDGIDQYQRINGASHNSTLPKYHGESESHIADWFVEKGFDVWIAHWETVGTWYDGYSLGYDANARCLKDQLHWRYLQSTNNHCCSFFGRSS